MPNQDVWKFYLDDKDRWRWRRIAVDNRIIGLSTVSYGHRADCVANAERHGYSTDSWEFFQDLTGEYRWQRRANDRQIVGASHEAYADPDECLANARRHGYDGTLT